MLDTAEFRRGRGGERTVAAMLMKRGWFVVPSYDYSGEDNDQAPKMERLSERLVIPDLDICRAGQRRWAEVKTKRCATFHRITQQLEHGISIRHFEHYHRVQAESGCQVWLFIVEEQSGTVLFQSLDALGPGRRWSGSSRIGYGWMVYWPRDSFISWAQPCEAA